MYNRLAKVAREKKERERQKRLEQLGSQIEAFRSTGDYAADVAARQPINIQYEIVHYHPDPRCGNLQQRVTLPVNSPRFVPRVLDCICGRILLAYLRTHRVYPAITISQKPIHIHCLLGHSPIGNLFYMLLSVPLGSLR